MDTSPIPARSEATDGKNLDRFFDVSHIKTDIKGRTVRGSALTVGSEVAKQVLWIISTIVLARLLSPSDNGLIAMAIVVTGFIDLFKDLGLSAATIQRAQVNHQQASTLFWINIGVSVGLALITAAFAPAVAWFYADARLFEITTVLATGFVLGGLTIQHKALLTRQMRFNILAIIEVSAVTVSTVVGIVAAFAGFGYWSLVLMKLAGAPAEIVATYLVCPWRPGRPRWGKTVRAMLAFGGNLTGYKMVNYLVRNVDNLLIGRIYGPLQLGLYAKAYALLLMPLQRINTPVSTVAIPALSRLVDQPERYRQAYINIQAKVCLVTMPLVAFMVGTANWLVLVLLGPQWVQAGTIFAWLGISGLIEPFSYTTIWLFLTQNRTRQQFYWGIISSTLMVSAIVVGLPWGPLGVATAYSLVSLFIRMPLLFWYVGREGHVRTHHLYAALVPFACTTGAVLLSIFGLRQVVGAIDPLLGLITAAVITAVVSFLTLIALPTGRTVLSDLKSLPALLFKRKVTT